jgi:hypothetical protein
MLRFTGRIPDTCVFEAIAGRANNIGVIRLFNAESGPNVEFVEEYEKVEEEFSRQVEDLAWNEWITRKIYAGKDTRLATRKIAENPPAPVEPEEQTGGNPELYLLTNFVSYTWPFSGATVGLGYAYTYTIVPGFLAPGLSASAAIHPKSLVKVAYAIGVVVLFFVYIFADDDEDSKADDFWKNSDNDDDDDDDEEEGTDYPWRTDFTLKFFNDFRFNKISLRPFWGRIFLSYDYQKFQASVSNWIPGAEVIYHTDGGLGLGMEFAYIMPNNTSPETDRSGIRCSVTLRI